ncbi:Ferrous iron transport protein A [Candidatus Hydrogenisulfobacillus filiaventi]|uniref:Ferrous iron transport protein A n=1 Tax=Candidatus Hydrogenisulfobacillus filiaventi TaxID=2707344 RepID=A0A6F8ZEA6_9FIRM|nr:ferrous iron transport protein A [Bacillota bacterium]CAB1128336.1 Ferrous iron transport protein A [Candidatus Hydrogenisulfobacillus filiaventi]
MSGVRTLAQAAAGERLRVRRVADAGQAPSLLRLGLGPGTLVTVRQVLPGGPVVVETAAGPLAVGRPLAEALEVEPAGA